MGYTKSYLESVEGLSLKNKIPLSQLFTAYNASRKEPDKQKVIREQLIKNYLKSAAKIAKRISKAAHLDLDELIQESNLCLCEYFSRERLTSAFKESLFSKLNHRLLSFSLEQVIENLGRERLTPEFIDPKKYNGENFGTINEEELFLAVDAKARKVLFPKEYLLFSARHPMYGVSKTLKQIGEEMHLTGTAVSNRYEKICWRVEKATGLPFSGGYHQRHYLEGTQYSLELVETLDQKLRAKQGIGLAELSAAFNFSPWNLANFVMRTSGISLNAEQKKEIYENYGGQKERKIRISREEARNQLEELHEKITSFLGVSPKEFIAYFNMSQTNFIKFVRDKFPGIEEGSLKRVIKLSEGESEKNGSLGKRDESKEMEILEKVLLLLETDSYNQYFPNMFSRTTDRLKHALFPVYINDPGKCLGMLEGKVEEYKGKRAAAYFREAYDFFKRGSQMQPARLKTRLDEFQRIDTLTLSDKGRHILASETGVGKSLEIIATAESLPVEKVLILTNKSSTIATWDKEIKKHVGDGTVVITGDSKDKDALFTKAKASKWVVCNYETYCRYLEKFKELTPDMVVIDEADIMNNPSSNRTKAILETNAKYKYCVSGWIYKNRRKELWPILNWLYPEEYPFEEQFSRDCCRDEWGRLRLKYDLSHKIIYRPKSLVLPNLPGLKLTTIPVRMTAEDRQEYLSAEGDFVGWYQENVESGVPNGVAITKLHSLRKLALKPKFPELYRRIRGRHQTQNKSVVFCSYLDCAREIAEEMGKEFQVGYFDGETSAQKRQDIIGGFNDSAKPELLVMSEAGGKSIELVAANCLYLFNPVWTYSLKKQIIDRLHRRGQKRDVRVYEFLTSGTLEESIHKRTEQKREEYEKTVTDALGYTSWFEENQAGVINSVIKDIVSKK